MQILLRSALARLALVCAFACGTGCIGSGVDVEATHPASAAAPVAELPPVGAMLAPGEPPVAASTPAAPDPHAHHHHHHGAPSGGTP